MYKLSYAYKIANKSKKTNADAYYWLFKTEICSYLFTTEALKEAENRATRHEFDLPSDKMFHPTKISYDKALLVGVGLGFLLGFLTTIVVCGNYKLLNFWEMF